MTATRELVIEEGPGYLVTADIEDAPPQHNHFDDRDSPWDMDECPRCRWDVERAPCLLCEEGDIVPHKASPRCESGSRPHCTCGVCFP